MNILPLVTAFMFLFALGAYTLLHQSMATKYEESHFSGAQRLHWGNYSQTERTLYKDHPGTILFPKKKSSSPPKTHLPYQSPRNRINLPESAKLNLAPLLFQNSPHPLLRHIALALINRLYQATSLYRPGLEEEVLSTLTREVRAHPDISSFQELFGQIHVENPLYYKLFKGTQKYTLFTSKGYPALSDFMTLDPKRASIIMPNASKPLLIALFGDAFANQLIKKEQVIWEEGHKHRPLKKEEIAMLFVEFGPPGYKLEDFDSFIDYSRHDKQVEQHIFYDEKSKIQLRLR